ncbi:MAG: dockerin type I repeat-containing protein [Planctomycetes bacterium]|nr:dockerin type I repeat-containing protein [Planctomycetota bacterium]
MCFSTELFVAGLTTTIVVSAGLSYVPQTFDGTVEVLWRPFIRGDCNQDAQLNLIDAVRVLELFLDSGVTSTCLDACDVNDNGEIGVDDAVYLLQYALIAGTPPPSPFPLCGNEPTLDDLSCNDSAACP